ncbi:MAG: diaminopimelate epimerase [Phaeodactylibacter sp.]|nr:diaminopimelate epimerase [Phaeodactylibacter sp.]
MQEIPFFKYHGAGNDFILLDQRTQTFIRPDDREQIAGLCHRRFGIGADGLIFLETGVEGADFYMRYFNADGGEGSMCGNGGRCTVTFAHDLGLIDQETRFLAVDGWHEARVTRPNWVELQMTNVGEIGILNDGYFLNTGSPHQVNFVEGLDDYEVFAEGRRIRWLPDYAPGGTNVNFIEKAEQGLCIRTFERGVEEETLACGTGITAAALAYSEMQQQGPGTYELPVKALGGQLSVRYTKTIQGFEDIWLCGPTAFVFKGTV